MPSELELWEEQLRQVLIEECVVVVREARDGLSPDKQKSFDKSMELVTQLASAVLKRTLTQLEGGLAPPDEPE